MSQMSENGTHCDKVHRYSITTEATSQAWNNSRENKETRPNGNLQEVEVVEEFVNKSVWSMFTIVDSRQRCIEFMCQ